MKKKVLASWVAAVMAATVGLTGCGSTGNASNGASTEGNGKQIVIGFSQVTLQSPFYVALMNAAKAEAKAKGAQLVYADAQSDIQKQNNDVQDLITKGVNVLLLNPVNPQGIAPSLAAAKSAHIPVVTVDRPANGQEAAFVGRDNEKMGEMAGEEAVKLLGGPGKAKGVIIEIQGAAGDKVMMARRDGFHKIVDQEKGIKVIQSPYCDYVRSEAVTAFQDLLQSHPDVNLVYAHNDDMALGALQVLKQNHLDKKVKIVGIDGLTEAIKAIQDGEYNATVLNDPQYEGKLAVDTALEALAGQKTPSFVDAGTALIDSSNASQYYNPANVFASSGK